MKITMSEQKTSLDKTNGQLDTAVERSVYLKIYVVETIQDETKIKNK